MAIADLRDSDTIKQKKQIKGFWVLTSAGIRLVLGIYLGIYPKAHLSKGNAISTQSRMVESVL